MTFERINNPLLPGVYLVQVEIAGRVHPMSHDPVLYSYFDGDSWSSWQFSEKGALAALMTDLQMRPWKPLKKDLPFSSIIGYSHL